MARKAVKRSGLRFFPRVIALIFVVALAGALTWKWSEPPLPDPPRRTASEQQAAPVISLAQLEPVRPQQVRRHGYVSSAACRECHPENHASWSASYHRRMTQLATPEAVIGDFADRELVSEGRHYQLTTRGGVCWVKMDDPELPAGSGQQIEVPIVMTTGSHHMQVYWYPTFEPRTVGQFPLVYLNETQQWIPRNAAFLGVPAPFSAETGRWNKTCIGCHTTHGQPRPQPSGEWDSAVGEFGISCEACHGPGEQHVRFRRDGDTAAGDPIVNPAQLPHTRASHVCGQCHSVNTPLDTPTFLRAQQEGSAFRPGDDLHTKKFLVRENAETRAHLQRYIGDTADEYMREQYWEDGMIRISGREYNGLLESACYQRGTLSCLSCHIMHQEDGDSRPAGEWANDQLRPEMSSDQACISCHDRAAYGGVSHTHHLAESTGSRCYNCHMPHTTYGLLKAIRSHEISSPDVKADHAVGRPNACNLCHLDKSLDWAADHTATWYGADRPALSADEKNVAASLLWLLRGDAGQRALAAWSMGWEPAISASGTQWQAPFLACLLDDPYDAVRLIADRSLGRMPGFDEFQFDFVGPAVQRGPARAEAWRIWHQQRNRTSRSDPSLLIEPSSGLDFNKLNELLHQRDDRPVNLAE